MPDTRLPLRHVEHVMGTVLSFDIRDRSTGAIRSALDEAVRHLHHVVDRTAADPSRRSPPSP
ncbi:hypothetical protein [Streptomyces sp. ACT015]|uniref:hypothetical protein n=1 Tax=Streptomyces sp. ACT015 TaxID=3134807 RepID=UPI003D168B78